MTLVEVLVVVVLLGFLASLILVGARVGNQAWSRVERQTSETADMESVQGLLRQTIASAYPAFISADINDPRIAFDGEPERLALVAAEPGSDGDGEWAVLRVHVEQHGASKALFLNWHRDLPAADGSATLPERQVLLLDHVAAVRLGYFGPVDETEGPGWVDRWTERDRLPAMVRIQIERDNLGLPSWPEFVVQTRVTTNVGCAYDGVDSRCHRIP